MQRGELFKSRNDIKIIKLLFHFNKRFQRIRLKVSVSVLTTIFLIQISFQNVNSEVTV